ncbi:single-stranded DNA-binding protein, mitochondrial [Cinnamomum micranthum f. kanehirae]|uniref:Single-stranded DNA-binding protein, mitochondrial n=1 Tax=Cinnamomum micranthum f. kanehirae TaxID=337451 RepID=A0A3S3NTG8_9MAGN|nr:single-stranded DNA-binding protein, mitochondrial [Cinnamomum micranthum f. kanehirae]
MASALSATTSRLCRSLLSFPKHPSLFSISSFSTGSTDDPKSDTDVTNDPRPETTDTNTPSRPLSFQRPLENGLDPGVYKAILVGQVGQVPVQKRLRSGRTVTLFSLGTGGIRNNRRPLDDEEPREYADRCAVQWHRVSVYPERLGGVAMKHIKPGSILYLEGNLETKIFSDPVTGLVRRIREIALRRDGRLVFLGKECGEAQSTQSDLKGVGYY